MIFSVDLYYVNTCFFTLCTDVGCSKSLLMTKDVCPVSKCLIFISCKAGTTVTHVTLKKVHERSEVMGISLPAHKLGGPILRTFEEDFFS
jgi:hypothetical protein